jgi:glutaredoxin-like YruB-family protein
MDSKNEKGQCALKSIVGAEGSVEGMNIYYADLQYVRDIHQEYNITTAPSLLEFAGGKLRNVIKGCNSENFYKALFEDAIYHAEILNSDTPKQRVTVYSTPTCSWCGTLKSYLKQNKISFTDIDVSADQRAAEELVRRSGQTGVPQIDINGEIIVGFNRARIDELLGIRG